MAKLTDTQLIVLSKAAAREDSAGTVPPKTSKAAAAKVGASLVARKLMREVRSKPGMPIWRESEDGRSVSLIITRAGRDAIGIEDDAVTPHTPDRKISSEASDPKLVAAEHQHSSAMPRAGSKQARVVTMLSTDQGVTLDALVEATGWLPHTTRAALTALRKRGYAVERIRHETGGSLYRIVGDHKPSAEA